MLKHWTEEQSKEWDAIIAKHAGDGGLLQSWAWGRFQEKLGNGVYNVSDEEGQWFAQCFQLKAGNQWILVVPRGPVGVQNADIESLKAFLGELKSFAKERGCFFVRLDPAFDASSGGVLAAAGCKKAKRERNPVQTLTIDTKSTEEELLNAMKSKWRYNIRLAEKKGVTVRISKNLSDADVFWSLVEKTTDRQGFASYDQEYFRVLIDAMGGNSHASFLIAELQGKPIAALLLGMFGHTTYYLHGASDYEYRQLMAPHLLQWHGILEAKKQGNTYDFWGVSEKEWPGVTRFKQGFAPDNAFTNYAGTYELPVKKWMYKAYQLRQLLKK